MCYIVLEVYYTYDWVTEKENFESRQKANNHFKKRCEHAEMSGYLHHAVFLLDSDGNCIKSKAYSLGFEK